MYFTGTLVNKDFLKATEQRVGRLRLQVSLHIVYLEMKSGAAQATPAAPTPTALW